MERGDVNDKEALRFVSAILTSKRYSQRRIAERFARKEPHRDVLNWAKKTYASIYDVRQWLKEEIVIKYMQGKSVNTSWF